MVVYRNDTVVIVLRWTQPSRCLLFYQSRTLKELGMSKFQTESMQYNLSR
jgi:hypothetical protein